MHQSVLLSTWNEDVCLIETIKALVIPAAYHSTQAKPGGCCGDSAHLSTVNNMPSDLDPDAQAGLLLISRGTAVLLLGIYVVYLFFQVSPPKITKCCI